MKIPDWGINWLRRRASWKFAIGGRGSAKTGTLVRAAMLRGYERPINVLCLREVQETLDESVHKVIRGVCAEEPELDAFYDVMRARVRGRNGTSFRFRGLSDIHGTDRGIRGAEDVDVFAIDEGQYITHESLQHLTPTVRKEGAEVWVAMNPRYDDDPLYEMAQQDDPDMLVYRVHWQHNPFWSDRQEAERLRYRRMYPDLYEHVYEGALVPDTAGRLFRRADFRLVDRAERRGRMSSRLGLRLQQGRRLHRRCAGLPGGGRGGSAVDGRRRRARALGGRRGARGRQGHRRGRRS